MILYELKLRELSFVEVGAKKYLLCKIEKKEGAK